ncbi:ATP-dependent helicase [Sodalis ligni]|jgi:DNA helicase-2/ATP-dependent DNA helicase PcrA|uniref:DNA 3'-5' helicase n=1 Tax=Sodalis ligni TaxID=2697027 RepID=A0A4R1NFR8_9GAMM|nr:UvrD-helicase domain-containing protein [Sodalis ligni]TCL03516.1 DNA helicase-2/ATP-dependent DNA helicase PcrA [Sodalis ligni]
MFLTHLPNDINTEQRAAITTTEGAVRVIAGAGTGKTRTLIERYCYLVSTLGIAPKNILCVTFTNRAANEMKRRVRAVLGDRDLGYICTFHAFCVQLLKEDIHVLNYPRNFTILDMEDLKQILQKIFTDMGLTLRDTTIKRTLDEVLEAKKLHATTYIDDIYQLDNEQLKARYSDARDRDEEIFLRYLYEQKKCFGVDFNDLINFATWILEHFPDVRQKWQDRMQYVMVDEFQDVSKRQYKLAQLLSGKHGNLFIVGDPDQTIYSWRGSHLRLFLDFNQVYPAAVTVALTTNYRSTPEILTAANTLIEKNQVRFPKSLHAVKASGPRARYFHAKSDKDEADWVVAQIQTLRAAGVAAGSIGVLYRAHYLTRMLEERFVENKLPYKIFSGIAFYERREIKDIICYLRMVTAGDDLAFLRTVNVPPRKIGKKKLEALTLYGEQHRLTLYQSLRENLDTDMLKGTRAKSYVAAIDALGQHRQTLAMDTALQTLLDQSGYEAYLRLQGDQDRLDNVAELKRAVQRAALDEDATLEDFLAQIALFSNLDSEEKPDTVKLMTIHSAKGMEYPYVFICGLNEGVFPSRRISSLEEMEEERRLAYVAMTRAMDRLYLSDAEGVANDNLVKYPSRFIFDAGEENIEYVVPLEEGLKTGLLRAITAGDEQLGNMAARYDVSDRVDHPVFGGGVIISVHERDAYYAVKFDALPTERNIQFSALHKGE